jgi:IclR family transcriptional regulator, blcABC operon repressor
LIDIWILVKAFCQTKWERRLEIQVNQNSAARRSQKPKAQKLVPALERGVRILDIVSKSKRSLNVTDIANELGVAKSSAHGLCITLVELNLLVRKSDQTYQLGPHIMRWANRFNHESDVAQEFASIWDESSQLPGATITLSVLEGAEVVYVAARNSEMSVGFDFRIGMRLPAPFTATGKSFLSYMSDFDIRRLIGNEFPEPLTKNSVQDFSELFAELKQTRTRGYSIDNQQVKDGMVCFGASVLNSRNRPIAGVAVSLSVGTIKEGDEELIVQSVQDIANKISLRLGAEL